MNDFDKKVKFAIKLLQSIPQEGDIEIAVSGGKDSDVILQLAKEAGIPFRAIHKCTTIDPPGTLKHVKDLGCEIIYPKKTFFELVRQKGLPTRRARFCCEHLKEYKILDRCVLGIRRSESTARAERYKEPEVCRVYSKKVKVKQYLPILYWTDEDVETYIKDRGVKCHPLYYDEEGNFHVERRLGCIGCPLKSDNGISDFKKYPKFLKLLIANAQRWLDTHPQVKCHKKIGDAYNLVYHDLFCSSYESYKRAIGGELFPELKLDCKQFLEDYFKIDLIHPKFYR